MNDHSPNPYQAPDTSSLHRGRARFRLRRWFALTLYLALAVDLFAVWLFGFRLPLISIPTFMLLLAASVFTRSEAAIKTHENGIEYLDLVQFVEVSWDRVARVIHKPRKTLITTDFRLAQITVSRKHGEYDAIMDKISDLQPEFGFEVSDFRI